MSPRATDGVRNGTQTTGQIKMSCGLATLGFCSIAYLFSALHAYLARTLVPWGQLAASLPFLLLGAGGILGLFYLLYPRAYWPIRHRAIGAGALAVLAGGSLVWDAAIERSQDRRPSELKAECLAHVSALTKALTLYADEYGHFPGVGSWREAAWMNTEHYGRDIFSCPAAPGTPATYAYNKELRDISPVGVAIPERVVVLFETNTGPGATGGPGLLPDEPRHFGGDNYGFADGHVQWIRRKKLPDGSWAKEPDADWVIWKPVLKKDAKAKGH